jgi:N-acetylneuraminic acid mutarotase
MQKIISLLILSHLSCVVCLADEWIQKADFGGTGRIASVGFAIDGKGYIGTGNAAEVTTWVKSFWEYDPITNIWTQKADLAGAGRSYAVGFSIGNKGYIGTGTSDDTNYEYLDDLWEYDPDTNAWTQKADFPGGKRFLATGFSIAGKGYIGLGADINNVKDDFWEYDPATDVWDKKADFAGGERYLVAGFSLGVKGYVGTGGGAMPYSDFWEYDPVTDVWTQRANFGGDAREQATCFVIGDYGYIGMGSDWSSFKTDFWRYDVSSDSWEQVADFPGTARYSAVGFSIGNRGYVGTGFGDTAAYIKEFWEYTPDSLSTSIGNTAAKENFLTVLSNPTEGSFEILFSLQVSSHTVIELVDMSGSRIKTLYDRIPPSGRHQFYVNCRDVESGIYLLQMRWNEEVMVKKIVIQ